MSAPPTSAIRGLPVLAVAAAVAGLLAAAPAARADAVESALGVPCARGLGGTQVCSSAVANRVRSWDGVPLDMRLVLPPADRRPPFPLIVILHGWPLFKEATLIDGDPHDFAGRGYAVLTYSSRGFGMSCGFRSSRTPECERGWTHLADVRFEARDSQHLAGRLADEGLVKPRRIGVTGVSYGGGQSFELAALKDRVVMPDGRFVPWRSPRGKRMRIAAAAPEMGWTSLSRSLVPGAGTGRIGVPKASWMDSLFRLGSLLGFLAPEGSDPTADLLGWRNLVRRGDPYDPAAARDLLDVFNRYHGAYGLQAALPRARRRAPAPILAYNSWADDLFPADEAVSYLERVRSRYPRVEASMMFAAGFGHPRAGIFDSPPPEWWQARMRFFDRHLQGKREGYRRLGVATFTQSCSATPAEGPFRTRTWAAQHPRRVRRSWNAAGTLRGDVSEPRLERVVDPLGYGDFLRALPCRIAPAELDGGGAGYRMRVRRGFVMIGAPAVRARLRWQGDYPQVNARLWDVSPDGVQTLVTRGVHRPYRRGPASFRLHPNGWRFRRGHTVKLELLGRDSPASQASNTPFTLRVGGVRLALPAR